MGQYYNIFRHYGHNIVVQRLVEPTPINPPKNLADQVVNSLHLTSNVNAQHTCSGIWSGLRNHGAEPVAVFVLKTGIGYYSVTSPSYGYIHLKKYSEFSVAAIAKRGGITIG